MKVYKIYKIIIKVKKAELLLSIHLNFELQQLSLLIIFQLHTGECYGLIKVNLKFWPLTTQKVD